MDGILGAGSGGSSSNSRPRNGSNWNYGDNGDLQDDEFTPNQVRNLFGPQFNRVYYNFSVISGSSDVDDTKKLLKETIDKILSKDDGGYLSLPENPFRTMRPIKYDIKYGDQVDTYNVIESSALNSHSIWGNPSALDSKGVPSPFTYLTDNSVTVELIIYFQQVFQ